MLEEFTPGEIVMKKTNFFIDGRPKLDEIIVRIIKDPSALKIAMETMSNGSVMAGSHQSRLEKAEPMVSRTKVACHQLVSV